MMRELGQTWRFEAIVLLKALRLMAQLTLLSPDSLCQQIQFTAAQHENTWTSAAHREMQSLGVPSICDWLGHERFVSKASKKRAIGRYAKLCITPAIHAREMDWMDRQLCRFPSVAEDVAAHHLFGPEPAYIVCAAATDRLLNLVGSRDAEEA
jgi:hypothetical protein